MTGAPRLLQSVAGAVAAAVLCSACVASSSGGDSCAAPQITVEPSRAAAGSTVEVDGVYFTQGCDDRGNGEAASPLQDQDVVLTVDGVETVLGTVDSTDGAISTSVQIPDTASPGPAEIRVGYSSPITIRIT